MGDLKVPWTGRGSMEGKPVIDDVASAGDSITQRGSDPLIDTGGSPAVQTVWPQDKYIVPIPGGEETANSVSGLPLQPNRFEPSETPPEMPDLTMRNPGTVDKK